MKLQGWLLMLLIGSVWYSCKDEKNGEKTIEEIRTESLSSNAAIIRNPVSANTITDTVNVAKIEFQEAIHDFGTVVAGKMVVHQFKFTNTGKVPLLINEARSTCGCTVPEYPKELIPPGESGSIQVRFNTSNMLNAQKKPVIITANTYPAETKVFLVGNVKATTAGNSEE